MAFHLNLFHEIHTEAHQRARDPAKLAGLGIALVALLLLGFYFYRMNSVSGVRKKAATAAAKWKKLEPEMKKAEADAITLTQQMETNKVLIRRLEDRFYWAPFLEQFAKSVPPHVQITMLSGTFHPTSRKVDLSLAGTAAGEHPRAQAEAFRVGLEKELGAFYTGVSAQFDAHSLEQTQRVIEFDGRQLGTARFRIQLTLQPAAPAEAPAAATP